MSVVIVGGSEVLVDEKDVHLLAVYRWYYYGKYVFRVWKGRGERRCEYLHRAIAAPSAEQMVDHINMNKLDNRRASLRVCTRSENACNCKRRSHNTSGVKGVMWSTQRQRWYAEIRRNGRKYHLGFTDSIDAAAKAYARASEELHGEFGRLA